MKAVILGFAMVVMAFVLAGAETVKAETGQIKTVRVVTDIAPVHSLVARVMQGVGAPDLLIRPGISPHDFTLRPSSARALQSADVVFWVGHTLTPRLDTTLDTIASSALTVELADIQGTIVLKSRQKPVFETTETHSDDHDHGHDQHGATDPHMWLDPENAKLWLVAIADTLAATDPMHAAQYKTNAQAALREVDDMMQEVIARLHPVRARGFFTFHDAYHYFEDQFDLQAVGAVLISDGRAPSAARLSELRAHLRNTNVVCVFSEPQFDPRVIAAVTDDTIKTAALDPMGVSLEPGADLYPALILGLATTIAECLSDR